MKPILFNTEMVKAILDGRKTATRRVEKVINPATSCQVEGEYNHEFVCDDFVDGIFTGFVCRKCGYGVSPPHCRTPVGKSFIKPPYLLGDILYVRETWAYGQRSGEPFKYFYKVDYDGEYPISWRPSIHMPKEAARIFLRVTDIRVEHLQDIKKSPPGPENQFVREGFTYGCDFIAGWDSTIKKSDIDKYGWNANPWVWVITFERISKSKALEEENEK